MQTLKEFIESYEVNIKFKSQFLIIDTRLKTLSLGQCATANPKIMEYSVVDWTHSEDAIVIHVVSDYGAWKERK